MQDSYYQRSVTWGYKFRISQPRARLACLAFRINANLTVMLTPTIKKHTYQETCVCLLPVRCRLSLLFSLLFSRSMSPSTSKVQIDFSHLKLHSGRMNREYMSTSTRSKALLIVYPYVFISPPFRQSAALLTYPGTSCQISVMPIRPKCSC